MAFHIPDPPDLDDGDDAHGVFSPDPAASVEFVDYTKLEGHAPEDVARWLSDPGEAPPPLSGRARWFPEDDAAAEWALRKMTEARATLAEIDRQHEAWTARPLAQLAKFDEWKRHAYREPASTLEHMTALLRRYALLRREHTGKPSVRLPHGRLTTRRNPDRVVVDHEPTSAAQLTSLGLDVAVKRPEPSVLVSKVPWVPGWAWQALLVDGSLRYGLVSAPEHVPADGDVLAGIEGPSPIANVVDVSVVPCVVDPEGELVQLEGLSIRIGEMGSQVEVF